MPTYITITISDPTWQQKYWRGTTEGMMRFLRYYEHSYYLTYLQPAPPIKVVKIEEVEVKV